MVRVGGGVKQPVVVSARFTNTHNSHGPFVKGKKAAGERTAITGAKTYVTRKDEGNNFGHGPRRSPEGELWILHPPSPQTSTSATVQTTLKIPKHSAACSLFQML